MSAAELAQEMWKRADSLDHLMARAEVERRRSRYMMISAIATAVSATCAAIAAIVATYVAYRAGR
jgi:hypothetical protein